nr:NAD(P)/FAD-dependent oxidoreductase [Pontibacter ruber]
MKYDVVLVGSGFGSLTAAALLVKKGLKVCVLEQAAYPGGCASSFKRKGYCFESGATTMVGLDEHMPLRYLLDETGIEVPLRKLDVPMQVHLPDGQTLTRYTKLSDWIAEAERVFGTYNQRPFWEHCYRLSREVWRTSLQQRNFPFSSIKDLLRSALQVKPAQISLLPAAFRTMEDLLRKYDLLQNKLFADFVNEQLLITAQNHMQEVNELFGATALCYTLYSNYYVNGGLINLVKPVVQYIESNGSEVLYRQEVEQVIPTTEGYTVYTSKDKFESRFLISGIPLNNTLQLFKDKQLLQKLQKYVFPSEKLNGAFTMGLVLEHAPPQEVLHHQVHVPEGLPQIGSKSIFISFSHPADITRAAAGETVVSISTHVKDPAKNYITDKEQIEEAVIKLLDEKKIIKRESIKYKQAATPGAWLFWTKRAFGMVGGYPQYRHLKPWQMKDARLDHKGAYLCGDTVYPGQGIVGVCLSGVIAVHKLTQDHL